MPGKTGTKIAFFDPVEKCREQKTSKKMENSISCSSSKFSSELHTFLRASQEVQNLPSLKEDDFFLTIGKRKIFAEKTLEKTVTFFKKPVLLATKKQECINDQLELC